MEKAQLETPSIKTHGGSGVQTVVADGLVAALLSICIEALHVPALSLARRTRPVESRPPIG